MAKLDNYAFDAMNTVDPDPNITGGAIKYSEYEMDMTPKDQSKYKQTLLNTLDVAYGRDPNKGKLNFKNWLKNLNPDIVKERALEWNRMKDEKAAQGTDPGVGMDEKEAEDSLLLEDAGLLQSLLDRHTGRLEDVYDVIGTDVPRPIEEFKVSERALRI